MNGAVRERLGERVVHQPVLIDERQPIEAPALDDHLEVVASARPVGHGQLLRVRKRAAQKVFQPLPPHVAIVVCVGWPR